MKDEIKEILDKPKILMLSCGNYISLDDYVKLKDYITNLQTIEQQYSAILSENAELQQELERYKNIIKNIKEEIELYIDITIDHFETSNEEINFELRNKCRAMREIKSEILEIIEKELKGE